MAVVWIGSVKVEHIILRPQLFSPFRLESAYIPSAQEIKQETLNVYR